MTIREWWRRRRPPGRHMAAPDRPPLLCETCGGMLVELDTVYGGRMLFDSPAVPAEWVVLGARYVLRADGRAINTVDLVWTSEHARSVLTLHHCVTVRTAGGRHCHR